MTNSTSPETAWLKAYAAKGINQALSFKQPFAWLISNGYLTVDDRTWGTPYRGPLLIHASRGLYEEYYDYLKSNTHIPLPPKHELGYGGIVGIARLVLCSKPGDLPASCSRQQRAQFDGINRQHFGFLFETPQVLSLLPCPGKLGIFEIDLLALLHAPEAAQAELF